MESTCLSSATSPFVVHSLIRHFSQPGSLKDSPLLMDHLLALGGACTWKLAVVPVLQPCLWDQTLGCLHLPPSQSTYPAHLQGTRTNVQPISKSPHCGAHPQHCGDVLVAFCRELAMLFDGAQAFSAWYPPLPRSWKMLPHFPLQQPGDCPVSPSSDTLPLASLSINH